MEHPEQYSESKEIVDRAYRTDDHHELTYERNLPSLWPVKQCAIDIVAGNADFGNVNDVYPALPQLFKQRGGESKSKTAACPSYVSSCGLLQGQYLRSDVCKKCSFRYSATTRGPNLPEANPWATRPSSIIHEWILSTPTAGSVFLKGARLFGSSNERCRFLAGPSHHRRETI
jgi:hypothetical protein